MYQVEPCKLHSRPYDRESTDVKIFSKITPTINFLIKMILPQLAASVRENFLSDHYSKHQQTRLCNILHVAVSDIFSLLSSLLCSIYNTVFCIIRIQLDDQVGSEHRYTEGSGITLFLQFVIVITVEKKYCSSNESTHSIFQIRYTAYGCFCH